MDEIDQPSVQNSSREEYLSNKRLELLARKRSIAQNFEEVAQTIQLDMLLSKNQEDKSSTASYMHLKQREREKDRDDFLKEIKNLSKETAKDIPTMIQYMKDNCDYTPADLARSKNESQQDKEKAIQRAFSALYQMSYLQQKAMKKIYMDLCSEVGQKIQKISQQLDIDQNLDKSQNSQNSQNSQQMSNSYIIQNDQINDLKKSYNNNIIQIKKMMQAQSTINIEAHMESFMESLKDMIIDNAQNKAILLNQNAHIHQQFQNTQSQDEQYSFKLQDINSNRLHNEQQILLRNQIRDLTAILTFPYIRDQPRKLKIDETLKAIQNQTQLYLYHINQNIDKAIQLKLKKCKNCDAPPIVREVDQQFQDFLADNSVFRPEVTQIKTHIVKAGTTMTAQKIAQRLNERNEEIKTQMQEENQQLVESTEYKKTLHHKLIIEKMKGLSMQDRRDIFNSYKEKEEELTDKQQEELISIKQQIQVYEKHLQTRVQIFMNVKIGSDMSNHRWKLRKKQFFQSFSQTLKNKSYILYRDKKDQTRATSIIIGLNRGETYTQDRQLINRIKYSFKELYGDVLISNRPSTKTLQVKNLMKMQMNNYRIRKKYVADKVGGII